ncbi:WD40 repeat-like protein [Ophiobolus disseminans]|uniref:WD40 repeat-like protein n=1 Tax=Ophiobolus disseminans TaxID=1469910 RepID=A0A6A7A6G1_9PLEO|nr:WD40 repeat-like protein [Ophiobolus disseminans]
MSVGSRRLTVFLNAGQEGPAINEKSMCGREPTHRVLRAAENSGHQDSSCLFNNSHDAIQRSATWLGGLAFVLAAKFERKHSRQQLARTPFPLCHQDWTGKSRFIMHHKNMIKRWLLQAYTSGLIFSHTTSTIKDIFKNQTQRFDVNPALEESWSACLQTLDGLGECISSVAFSPDGTRQASGSNKDTIKVWNEHSGQCLQTLEGHGDSIINSVAFSPDRTRLALGSDDDTIKVWDAHSGQCLQTLEGLSSIINSVASSPCGPNF